MIQAVRCKWKKWCAQGIGGKSPAPEALGEIKL